MNGPMHPGELEALLPHLCRHAAESGQGGEEIFRPYPPGQRQDADAQRARLAAALELGTHEPCWTRVFLARAGDRVVGHATLRGGTLPATLHRATLEIGVEAPHRRGGIGRALVERCIAWARAEGLVWLDLGVFTHNGAAIALYEALGFQRVGLVRDQFRVAGQSIDEIRMTLEVR